MLNPAPGVFDLDEAAPCFVGSVAGLETGVLEPLGCHYVEFFRADPPELVQVVPRFYTELLDCPGATCRNIRISTCPIRIRNLFNRWTGPLPIHPIHNPQLRTVLRVLIRCRQRLLVQKETPESVFRVHFYLLVLAHIQLWLGKIELRRC